MKKVRRVVVGIMTMVLIFLLLPTEYMEVKAADEIISTGQCGPDATYVLTADGTLTISGTGMIGHHHDGEYGVSAPDYYKFRDQIKNVIVSPGITKIETSCDGGYYGGFRDCKYLETISLPSGLLSIESYAFYGCKSLKNIEIPESVTKIGAVAFSGCSSLKNIEIPDSVIDFTLGEVERSGAFEGCSNLESIVIPSCVTSIGKWAFSGCTSLETVVFSDNIKSIGDGAFSRCSSLKNVELPEGITEILSGAFYGCSSLKSIVLPDSLVYLDLGDANSEGGPVRDYQLFGNCSSLESIVLPNCVTSIGYEAFSGCSNLTEVTIPASVKKIGWYAFSDCSKLENVSIACGCIIQESFNNNTRITHTSHKSIIVSQRASEPTCTEGGWTEEKSCSTCGEVVVQAEPIPAKGHTWGTGLVIKEPTFDSTGLEFYSCETCEGVKYESIDKLQNLEGTCGDGVTYELSDAGVLTIIGSGDITTSPWSESAGQIKSVVIADGVTGICANAFRGCSNLIDVDIPDSVKYIGIAAFFGCSQLEKVTITCDCECSSTSFPSYIKVERIHGEKKMNSAIEPNCTQSGWTEETVCSTCNEVLEAKTEIPVKGHQWNDGIVIKEATLTSEGFVYYTCTVCSDKKYETTEMLKSTSGSCGETLAYELSEDGTLTIEGNGDMDTCPWSVGAERIKKVIISDGITSVGANAFRNCSNLVEITLPDSVASIEVNAFRGCTALESIDIPSGVTYIGNAAFFGCSKLTKLTISCGCLRAVSAFPSYIEIELTHGEEKVIPAVEASCKKAGWTEETVCSVCGEVFIAKEEIPLAEHVWNAGVVTKEPSVFAEGKKTYTCFICHNTKTEEISKLNPKNGWKTETGKKVYYVNDEKITGWKQIEGVWYYFATDGSMEISWEQISGKWYYFGKDGKMTTGWRKIGSVWYYFTGSGAMVTGWKQISNKWYYFDNGAMATGWQKIADEWYYFDDGAMVTGWKQLNSKWYYFETSGVMAADKWINDTYYVKANGVMAANEWVGKYYVDANGKYVKGARR